MSTGTTTAGATASPLAATASASTATESATAPSGSATTSLGNATAGATASQGEKDWYVESLRTYRKDLTTHMTLQGQLLNHLLGRNSITRKQYDTIKKAKPKTYGNNKRPSTKQNSLGIRDAKSAGNRKTTKQLLEELYGA